MLNKISHLYINFPFCPSICHFCNFYKNPQYRLDEFFKKTPLSVYLVKELKLYSTPLSSPLHTLYLGGGSPLEMPPIHLKSILEYLTTYIQKETEVTVESNPSYPIYLDYLSFFNRISIGIQSFNTTHLKTLGRHYPIDSTFLKEVSSIISNISYDLLFDIPNQSLTEVKKDLDQAINYYPKHISYYPLEETTRIKKIPRNISSPLEKSVSYIQQTMEKNNYFSYELSSFSKKGYASIHNQAYWEEQAYLGIGPGASGRLHKKDGIYRYTNHYHLEKYKNSIEQGLYPYLTYEKLSPYDIQNEYIMLQIRRPWGINRLSYKNRFDKDLLESNQEFFQQYQKYFNISKTHIYLNKKGIIFSNHLVSLLFK